LFTKGGESSYKGLYFTQVSVFGDSCQRGEGISPKQKDRTTTNFQKFELRKDFSIDDFSIGILLELQIGSTLSKLISKTLLNTKRRI
jgi:hypothetical protein